MGSKNSRATHRRSRTILIFGEDQNDTKAIRELILAALDKFNGKVKALRRPPVYSIDANRIAVRNHVSGMCDVIRAEMATSDVVGVFIHRDTDALEPAHIANADGIERSFQACGSTVTAITPAWELEAWLFLWPTAVQAYRPSWKLLNKYAGRNVGLIKEAKEEFRRAVRSPSSNRDYRESDAPLICRKVRELGIIDGPAGRSDSFHRFRKSVGDLSS